MESWRPIKGFDKVYEVSDYGHVRRILGDGRRRPVKIIFRETGGKYSARVWLYNGPKNVRNVMIARLVWENFVGQIPEGMVVTHKNGLRMDNDLRNLELVTVSEHFKKFAGKYSRKPVIKLDRSGNVVKVYPSCTAAAEAEGYSRQNIYRRVAGLAKDSWDFDFAYEESVKSRNDALRRLGVKKKKK